MKLAIDLDSVLVQLLPTWLQRYNQEYQDQLCIEDITVWEMERLVRRECGPRIYRYLQEPGFFRTLPPVPKGPEILERLQEEGHEIFLATASPLHAATAMWDKLQWTQEHLPFLDPASLIFIHPKHLLQTDLLFDDSPTQLDHFPGISVAMDYPYNRGHGDYRVASWPEFYHLIHQLHKTQFERRICSSLA